MHCRDIFFVLKKMMLANFMCTHRHVVKMIRVEHEWGQCYKTFGTDSPETLIFQLCNY
jgi:hypothetical protein